MRYASSERMEWVKRRLRRLDARRCKLLECREGQGAKAGAGPAPEAQTDRGGAGAGKKDDDVIDADFKET